LINVRLNVLKIVFLVKFAKSKWKRYWIENKKGLQIFQKT
jgi:hypothetical protein